MYCPKTQLRRNSAKDIASESGYGHFDFLSLLSKPITQATELATRAESEQIMCAHLEQAKHVLA